MKKRILKQNIYLKLDIKLKKKKTIQKLQKINHTGKVHVTLLSQKMEE